MIDLFCHAVNTRLEDIIKTYIRSETEHKGGLGHVGTDHSAGTNDEQFFISKIFHLFID